MGFLPTLVSEVFQRASGKSIGDPAGAYLCPGWGLTRRLRREGRAYNLHGVLIYFGGDPKGVQGASGKPPACSDRQQLCRKQIPLVGIDAPTPARIGTGRPKGRSHFSFDGERKVCKRKPAARRLQRRPTSLRTAAKPCATLVLGYALHGLRPFLALVGLRPPLVAGFVLR